MTAAKPKLADLSDGDRQVLESLLVRFDQQWDEGLLAGRVGQIPPDSSWRLPALAEMVKIDLERHWQRGRRISLEAYLADYPELGNPADVTADLIHAEYEIRRQFGAPVPLEDYARRFPRQVEELRRRIARGDSSLSGRSWVSGRSPVPGSPGPSPAGRAQGAAARPLPEQLGRYRIIKRLGQGGMGSVYLAEDTRLKRLVALKIPQFQPEDGPQVLDRFYREATAAATLDHPYLCPVYDVGDIDGIHYLAMAYIEGQSLAESLRGDGGQPQRQVAALVGKLAVAMQQAHARKVIHRDLKPANIMIKASGRRREPVIVDFGLACHQDAPDVRVTKTGQVLGTLAYMAPEQLRGDPKAVGPACDIYAMGVILYELLTGQLPFGGLGLAIVAQILTQPPLPPSKLRPDLDPRLEAICLKAMAKEAGDRYASMAELAAALTGYLRAEPASPAVPASSGPAVAPRPEGGASRPTGSSVLVDQFLARVAAEQAAIPILDPKPQPAIPRRPVFAGRRPPWPMTAAAATFGVLLLGVIIYVSTDKGRIKIVVDDPKAIIRIDGEEVRIEELGEPITLRAGEHELTIRHGDAETESRTFVVRRGNNEPLRVTYNPKSPPGRPIPEIGRAAADLSTADSPGSKSPVPPAEATGGVDGFTPLFNGKNFGSLRAYPSHPANWRVMDEILTGRPGSINWLFSEQEYSRFVLRFQFQVDAGSSGAVTVWALPDDVPLLILLDRTRAAMAAFTLVDKRSGAWQVHRLNPDPKLRSDNAWNDMAIEVNDRFVGITLNGEELSREDIGGMIRSPTHMGSLQRKSGRIGFQWCVGKAVRFRNILVKELPNPAE